MDQRAEFINAVCWKKATFTAVCRLYGITRQTGYKWWNRWKREKSVEEKSRRPKGHPRATSTKLTKLIVSQRKQFPLWGPIPIRNRLQELWPSIEWPSASTIGAILKRHGMVKPRRKRFRAAPRTQPFSKCREPNDVWCVDFKGHFKLGDGTTCYPLTVIDAASRYLLACVAMHHPTHDNVHAVFVELLGSSACRRRSVQTTASRSRRPQQQLD